VGSRAGVGSGPPPGVKPGALTDLLRQVAGTPEQREAEPLPLRPGAVIGRFEIVRELGRGAFGVVYEARDRELGRQVALKMVRPGSAAREDGKVVREAEAIARLAHPNLVTLYDVGQCDGGPYLVFELLRGKTLQERIDDGPLPVQEAVHIATDVARGLAHAHAEGVVHRDLKPANVLVTNKGQVKILDFGMAHAFGRKRLSGGTPAYMAPEQWEDAPEDERTDVFALGVMLYRMLSGEYPFREGEGRWAADATTLPKLDVPGAPELAELVEKMLDRSPIARPRDGAAVLAALTPIEEALRARPADGSAPAHATKRKATLGDLLAEMKRRRVFRVMVGYGIFAFALLQVTEPIMHGAHLPDWVLTAVLVALAVGFPVAVILAWVFDLTAQGVKRTPSMAASDAVSFSRGRLAMLLLGVALLAATPGAAWYLWKQSGERGQGTAGPGATPSIAVLPFADLSPGKDQEYLSDGIAEEILDALSRVEGLRVAGRTSSFYFRGKGTRLADIGRELNVGAVLEGGVRRDGDRIRVTAKIVNVRDGLQTWSQRWDRDLKDILAVESEIAREVVEALEVRLLGGRRPTVPGPERTTAEAHLHVLKGREFFRRGSAADVARAVEEYERALKLDPNHSSAWAGLAMALDYDAELRPTVEALLSQKQRALEAADRAVATGPQVAEAYVVRANLRGLKRHEWAEAWADVEKARSLGALGADGHHARARLLAMYGRLPDALAEARRAVEFEPLCTYCIMRLGFYENGNRDFARGQRAFERVLAIAPDHAYASGFLAQTLVLQGRPQEALSEAARSRGTEPWRVMAVALAEHALGHPAASKRALDDLMARFSHSMPFQIAEVCAWRGELDCAFKWLDRADESRDLAVAFVTYSPLLANIRGDSRYVALLRKLNLPVDGQAPSMVSPPLSGPSIAVLPFTDLSPRHDQEYFADGMAEEILNSLAQIEGLRVAGRTSAFAFKGKNEDLVGIAQKLRVGSILEGSVRLAGNRVRITAQLINAADGYHVWSQTYDRELTGIFAVQDEIARAVVGALKVKLLGDRRGPAPRLAMDPEAYRLYLLGRQLVRLSTAESYEKALAALRQAALMAPNDPRLRSQLALALWFYFILGVEKDPLAKDEWWVWWRGLVGDKPDFAKVNKVLMAMAEEAVALGGDLPEPWAVRGFFRHMFTWDGATAQSDLQHAISLAPGDVPIRIQFARVLATAGRLPEALDIMARVTEADPLSPSAWLWMGILQNATGQPEPGEASFQRGLAAAPAHAYLLRELGVSLLLQGKAREALALAERHPVKWFRCLLGAMAQHQLGNEEASREALEQLTRGGVAWSYQIAQAHAWRGERDLAMEWLERGYAANDPGMRYTSYDPTLRSLRGDPRYRALLRKMRLAED
jgi:TolB-like protein/Flp pilus assembly protein TadD